MTRSWWIIALVVMAGRAAGQGALFDQPGEYAYVPDSGQQALITHAVDQGVSGMLPTAHRIARRRLLETNHIPQVLRIIVVTDSVGTQQDSGKAMTLPRSGETVKWDDGHGDVCKARETVVADTLTQSCDAGSGGSADQYVLDQDGQRLRLIVHITSPHLGGPVDYTLQFHRP